jgi:hypothetical protein
MSLSKEAAAVQEMSRLNFVNKRRAILLSLRKLGLETFVLPGGSIIQERGNRYQQPPAGGWGQPNPQGGAINPQAPAPIPVTAFHVQEMAITDKYIRDFHPRDHNPMSPDQYISMKDRVWAIVEEIIFEKGNVSDPDKTALASAGLSAPYDIWARLTQKYSGNGMQSNILLVTDCEGDFMDFELDAGLIGEQGAMARYIDHKDALYDKLPPLGSRMYVPEHQTWLLRGVAPTDMISKANGTEIVHPYQDISLKWLERVNENTRANLPDIPSYLIVDALIDAERRYHRRLAGSKRTPKSPPAPARLIHDDHEESVNVTEHEEKSAHYTHSPGNSRGGGGYRDRGRGVKARGRGDKGSRGRGGKGDRGGNRRQADDNGGADVEEETGEFEEKRSCFKCGGRGHVSPQCPSA